MSFHKYSSIENITNKQKYTSQIPEDSLWAVSEKAHGANCQLTSLDGLTVLGAKRSSLFTQDELKTFYGVGEVIDKYKDKVLAVYQHLKAKHINVFGELIGGSYPGFTSTRKPVQREVFYCPNVDLIFFDIQVDGIYLPDESSKNIFIKFEFPFMQNNFIGTFDKCVEFSKQTNLLPSSIPKIFYQEPIQTNIREGNVIKPFNFVLFFQDRTRAIFKDKNQKFKEQNILAKPIKKQHNKKDLSELTNQIREYLVEMRWNGVVSKEGPCTLENKAKYISLFIADAIEDYAKDQDTTFTLEKIKAIKNNLFPQCFNFTFCCFQLNN